MRVRLAAAALIAFALPLAMPALAATPGEKQIDEMTDVLVSMLPVGAIMEEAAGENPAWPVQDKPDAVTPVQLACLRSELSRDGFRRVKRAEVAEYARAHPGRFAEELQLARTAAPVFGSIVQAGIASAKTDTDLDPADLMRTASADQLLALLTIARDPEYRDFRTLSGFGDVLAGDGGKADGKSVGEMAAIRMMFQGMKACDVSPGALM